MKLSWVTDLHVGNLGRGTPQLHEFLDTVTREKPDAIVITGDISISYNLCTDLGLIRDYVDPPVYFVLGNHDLWYGSIKSTHGEVGERCMDRGLTWLHRAGVVPLTDTVALVGADGWYDGRAGNYGSSGFRLNDMNLIHDFKTLTKDQALGLMQKLADTSTRMVIDKAEMAISEGFREVFIATHVPPFVEASNYRGRPSEREAWPFYVNRWMGEELTELATANPEVEFTVLAGHTHSRGRHVPVPNLVCHVGPSQYGAPCISKVFEYGGAPTG